jgi:hypothetical protein
MLSVIQITAVVLCGGVALTLTSESFAFAVSRVMEAAFERVELHLALRARSRAERLKSRRRDERRRVTRARAEGFAPAEAYLSQAA